MMRIAPDGSFDRVPLIASAQAGTFEGMLFHLEKPTEYYVESNGVRSGKFMLDGGRTADGSATRSRVPLPRYTGLEPRKAEGGDVAAIRGTDVMLHVVPTMTTPDGKILLSDGAALAADAAGRRIADRQLSRSRARASTASSSPARTARRSRRRRSIRSTSSTISRRPCTSPSRDATPGEPGRGALPRGAGRRRLRREVSCSCSTRSTAERRRR